MWREKRSVPRHKKSKWKSLKDTNRLKEKGGARSNVRRAFKKIPKTTDLGDNGQTMHKTWTYQTSHRARAECLKTTKALLF